MVECNQIGTLTSPAASILDAVLTVSPNRQYLGIFNPTTPATTVPECIPEGTAANNVRQHIE